MEAGASFSGPDAGQVNFSYHRIGTTTAGDGGGMGSVHSFQYAFTSDAPGQLAVDYVFAASGISTQALTAYKVNNSNIVVPSGPFTSPINTSGNFTFNVSALQSFTLSVSFNLALLANPLNFDDTSNATHPRP